MDNASEVMAHSVSGTTHLILIQLISRASTFAVNQFILRALSPTILGIATQLELFSITTLYFSRESIRIAVQRQPLPSQNPKAAREKTDKSSHNEVADKANA